MSRPSKLGEPVKLLRLVNAHLHFRVERGCATCIVCHELKGREDEPTCERCGLGAFHLSCYTEMARFTIFLCPGAGHEPQGVVPP